MSEKTISQPAKKSRMLGWDTWRFWGAFTIFWGHNLFALTSSNSALFAEMQPKSLLELLYYPDMSWSIVYAAVPVFVFISGYFALRKKPSDNDWATAWNHTLKYLLYVVKWSIIGLLLIVIFPGIWPGFNQFTGTTIGETLLNLFRGIVNCNMSISFMWTTFNVNYFVLGLAWMMLLSPMFRYFLHNVSIKAARTFVGIFFTFLVIFPLINTIGYAIIYNNPASLLGQFMHELVPFTTQQWTWDNFWIAYFLFGGLFAIDTELQEKVKNIKWVTLVIYGVFAYVATNAMVWLILYNSDLSYGGLGYNKGSGLLLSLLYIAIAVKLNDKVKEDSFVGRFVSTYAGDLLGVMTMGLMFGTQIMTGIAKPLMAKLATLIWFPTMPWLTTILWILFNMLYELVLILAVHVIRKIPKVGSFIFDFPKLKTKQDW